MHFHISFIYICFIYIFDYIKHSRSHRYLESVSYLMCTYAYIRLTFRYEQTNLAILHAACSYNRNFHRTRFASSLSHISTCHNCPHRVIANFAGFGSCLSHQKFLNPAGMVISLDARTWQRVRIISVQIKTKRDREKRKPPLTPYRDNLILDSIKALSEIE